MSVGVVIIGLFFYFFFKWLFRVLFVTLIIAFVKKGKEELSNLKGDNKDGKNSKG